MDWTLENCVVKLLLKLGIFMPIVILIAGFFVRVIGFCDACFDCEFRP